LPRPTSPNSTTRLYAVTHLAAAAFKGSPHADAFTSSSPRIVSPIVFNAHLHDSSAAPTRALYDPGAGLTIVNRRYAVAHGLKLLPLAARSAARLPNGAVLPISEQCLLPLAIGPSYTAVVRAHCLPLHDDVDVILGMPWSHSVDAVMFTRQRQVSVTHKGRRLFLHEATTPPPPRHGAGVAGASSRSRPTLLPDPAPPPPPSLPTATSASPDNTPPSPDSTPASSDYAPAPPPAEPPPSARRPTRPAPAPDIHAVRAATLPDVEALTAKQWRRARRAGTISNDDVLLFYISADLEATASTLDREPVAVFSISDHVAADDARLAAIDPALPSRLHSLLSEFETQFKDFPDTLPPLDPDLLQKIRVSDNTPVSTRPYRLSPPQLASCREQLRKLLDNGLIRPTASPYASPVLMVPKAGQPGAWRLTVDYRALNDRIERDSFPIPHPTDVFNELAGHKFYSRLDLASGFWQIRLDPCDEDKTAFVAPTVGQFAWRVLPMGLKTAPSVFARMMQKVLRPYLGKFCVTYLDDIGIYSDSLEAHLEHIRLVLAALREHNLFAKLSKCAFARTEMEFLGHIVSATGIAVDPAKVSSISDWPAPASVSDLRAFLGLSNYYRDFVSDYSHRSAPLTDLLSSKTTFVWGAVQDAAFKDLKGALTSAPVLQPYRADRPITLVMSDASSAGLGAVLMQADSAGRLHPVAYHSRKLSPAERNYPTREQELLAIVDALKSWRHYLLGIPFKVETDHASLRYLQTQPHLSGRLVRWSEYLQEYDFTVAHIPGKDNHVADALSRRADFVASLRPDLAADLAAEQPFPTLAAMSAVHSDLRAAVLAAQQSCPTSAALRLKLRVAAPTPAAPIHLGYKLSPEGGLLWVARGVPRLLVPAEPASLRRDLLRAAHDSACGAHLGVDKTYGRLAASWYWPRMFEDTRLFVTSCHACLGNKSSNRAPAGLARPLPPPTRPWAHLGLDISGPHPTSADGSRWLVVFVCHFSKQVHLVALPGSDSEPLSAERIADAFFSKVVKYHGLPDVIVSDRGPQWLSTFWSAVFARCGTDLRFSTAYHPQTDGASERAIRTVVDTIRCCLDGLHEHWDRHLDAIELAYNSSVHASTGLAPFELLYGFNPRLPHDAGHPSDDAPGAFLARRHTMRMRASDVIVAALLRQASQIDKHRRPIDLKVGDYVWLSTSHLNLAFPNKFTPKYLGPFEVSRVLPSGNACKLVLPPTIRVANSTFNTSQLREHVLRPAALGPSAPPQPPPAFFDAQGPSYHIDKIIGHKLLKAGVSYSLRWLGFGAADDTWETEASLLTQNGGRIAIALYRARKAAVDSHSGYAKRRAKRGLDAPLPPLSAADFARVAQALRDFELARAAAPAPSV
jgi:transposase InsO family protein